MFGRKKKHEWYPIPGNSVFIANNKVWIVERCIKTGAYRYVRVPSNTALQEQERE